MTAVVRPDWWCYPLECPAGHPWAPGRVTVGWMPCDCQGAISHDILGHLWVRCRTEGCSSIWYRPRHESDRQQTSDGLPQIGLSERRAPGAWRGRVTTAADFDQLPAEIEAAFRGEGS